MVEKADANKPALTRRRRVRADRRRHKLIAAGASLSLLLAGAAIGQHYLLQPTTDTVEVTASHYEGAKVGTAWSWPPFRRHKRGGTTPTPTPTPSVKPSSAPTAPPSSPTSGSGSGSGTGAGSGSGPAGTNKPAAGVPASLSLRKMGSQTVSKDGTVIDGADISGGVVVTARNVVIKNSRVSGSDGDGISVRSGSATIQDTTVTGFSNSITGDNYTSTRVEVTKQRDDGYKIGDNVTIQDSWCHDPAVSSGAHADCGQVQSGVRNVVIRGNWFDVGSSGGNAALFLAPDLGPSSPGPMLVENNVLGGGNFAVQCVDGANGKFYIGGITIRNNAFLSNSQYGALRVNVPAAISGNIMQATKKAVSA